MIVLTEQNNVLVDFDATATTTRVLQNIDIEGGGRVWLQSGDNNADIVQQDWTQELLQTGQTLTGIYVPVSIIREKMYSRMIDALLAPITLKMTVQGPSGGNLTNLRLIGRRMIPDAVHDKGKGAAKVTK
jgi:hypothetical protein